MCHQLGLGVRVFVQDAAFYVLERLYCTQCARFHSLSFICSLVWHENRAITLSSMYFKMIERVHSYDKTTNDAPAAQRTMTMRRKSRRMKKSILSFLLWSHLVQNLNHNKFNETAHDIGVSDLHRNESFSCVNVYRCQSLIKHSHTHNTKFVYKYCCSADNLLCWHVTRNWNKHC